MKAEKDQTKEERQTSHINNEKYNEYAEYEIRDNENLPARRKLESALLNYESKLSNRPLMFTNHIKTILERSPVVLMMSIQSIKISQAQNQTKKRLS